METVNYVSFRLRQKRAFALIIFFLLISCKKKEFQRPEEGKVVVYKEEVNVSLKEFITGSSPLIQAIWKKGELESLLQNQEGYQISYTVLLPTDESLLNQGWTLEKVELSNKETIQSLLLPHLAIGTISDSVFNMKNSGKLMESLYTYHDVYIQHRHDHLSKGAYPLKYNFSVHLDKDQLYVNGVWASDKKPIQLIDAIVYSVNTILEPPQITVWEYLKSNEDFSLYTTLLEKTDSLYKELYKEGNGHYPIEGHELELQYDRSSIIRFGLDVTLDGIGRKVINDKNTYFIPTNQAFNKAGFYKIEDLLTFNETRNPPQLVWQETDPASYGFYKIEGEFATDSLLDYHHNWGLRYAQEEGFKKINNISLFSTDWLQSEIRDFPIALSTKQFFNGLNLYRSYTKVYLMPFKFEENSIRLSQGNVEAGFTRKNKLAVNGIIHEVDQLLVPADFKF